MAALNLGAAGSAPAVVATHDAAAWWGWPLALVPVLLAILLARAAARRRDSRPAFPVDLASLPAPARLAVLFYVIATALTHLFAVGAIWQATRVNYHGNAEYFRYMSLLQLFRMSHQHAFGHGTMYFLLGLLVAATRAGDGWKVLAISLTGLGASADLASWWLQKFSGPSFEPLSVTGGACFAAGYALAAALILRELVRRAPSQTV